MKNYNWAIVGPGRIAEDFCSEFPSEQTLYGVASSHDPNKAKQFAKKFNIKHTYQDYEDLLNDPQVDIVYVATTNNFHFDNIRQALTAGKHVFSEKPVTLNTSQLQELITISKEKHLILMEAQTIYHMPLYDRLTGFIRAQQLGKLKSIQVSFGMHIDKTQTKDRLLNPNLAGGALLDMGIYAISFARRFMTAAPKLVATQMVPTATGVDDVSTYLLTNDHNELCTMNFNMLADMPTIGYVIYENGYFIIENYLRPENAVFINADTGEKQLITAGKTDIAMGYEALDMAKAVETGDNDTLDWTIQTMNVMTQARKDWDFKYPNE